MPILGLGTDIIHIPRLRALLSRHPPARFARRILSPSEREAFAAKFATYNLDQPLPKREDEDSVTQRRLVTFLAARWAAKEAAFKAMYPIWYLKFSDVSIRNMASGSGKPYLDLNQAVAVKANVSASHVSMSHDGDYAIAQVLFERSS
ncbi:hypothetical protein HDU89_000766 [Geranomyces variabilis]|nr:hypothetical protein HDU89_000766 [Geranomyces variabilis]